MHAPTMHAAEIGVRIYAHTAQQLLPDVYSGFETLDRLIVYDICFNLVRFGIDIVGLVAELTDAVSTSNGLNTLTYSYDISHPSSLSSDISIIKI
jgi:hypothetical protein